MRETVDRLTRKLTILNILAGPVLGSAVLLACVPFAAIVGCVDDLINAVEFTTTR